MCAGDINRVISLIKEGANVNEKESEHGFAPLHFSAGAGKLRFLSYIKITMVKTPVSLSFKGLENITKILIDNGAIVDIRSDEERTPLEIASVNGNL